MASRRVGIAAVFLVIVAGGLAPLVTAMSAADLPSLDVVVRHAGERLAAYYKRAQQLVCVERSTVVPIDPHWTQQGFARTVESELRLELDGEGGEWHDPRVTRETLSVNGRLPRERDRKDRSGCTDPTPLSPEPLAFLLPEHRDEYRFTAMREGRERNRAAFIIDFASREERSRPELIRDELGHDDCFDWKGPLAVAGRVWIDALSYDVLRLERRVPGPTDVRVPLPLQRTFNFSQWLTLERDDLTLRYKEVAFSDPDEVVLLPESIESITVFRGELQSVRRRQEFRDYRRFLAVSRIKGVR